MLLHQEEADDDGYNGEEGGDDEADMVKGDFLPEGLFFDYTVQQSERTWRPHCYMHQSVIWPNLLFASVAVELQAFITAKER